ncbi:transcriptional regulator, ArsR family [Thermoanaerobacterium xylanolyticum LX-11]|uniref:Transcriptional regulator, ArsR family n=1 Tax=Thermoanaerobacterium xylanolyticum (strain ATCC 49914 / DSM 7097 / LX-11) TaxID=858215 RepID=F6BHE9_THEXL|nr:metalloregulator ArsR/SmtB family transcription factor [Thermoanaerobacterium xylanolyticum]AEF16530.1 transcriptional regulator, ArsR family [Thermoanaerobacterium xylanolyticum LX-11]
MNIVGVFKALCDENRLRIFNLLSQETLCVCDIETILNMTQSNVSRHLNKLKSEGIITFEKKAQWAYYKIDDNFIKENKLLYDYLTGTLSNYSQFILDNENLKKHKESKLSCEQLTRGGN